MKIYTKSGDKGITSLYDGNRISKTELIFDILGEFDELSSRIGVFFCFVKKATLKVDNTENYMSILLENINYLRKIQINIQDINSIIATVEKNKFVPTFTQEKVNEIEQLIDNIEKINDKLTVFILPGENMCDAHGHLCRTQVRKVERFLWELHNADFLIKGQKNDIDLSLISVSDIILSYMNRLSDYFFVFCRFLVKTCDDNI
tara:strand:- start:33109 stop:33720 length:612 start_codon:yes stop_codon:yes gene_type:complete